MRGFFGCRILGTDRLAAGLFVWTDKKTTKDGQRIRGTKMTI